MKYWSRKIKSLFCWRIKKSENIQMDLERKWEEDPVDTVRDLEKKFIRLGMDLGREEDPVDTARELEKKFIRLGLEEDLIMDTFPSRKIGDKLRIEDTKKVPVVLEPHTVPCGVYREFAMTNLSGELIHIRVVTYLTDGNILAKCGQTGIHTIFPEDKRSIVLDFEISQTLCFMPVKFECTVVVEYWRDEDVCGIREISPVEEQQVCFSIIINKCTRGHGLGLGVYPWRELFSWR
jgi:hypothetical protein